MQPKLEMNLYTNNCDNEPVYIMGYYVILVIIIDSIICLFLIVRSTNQYSFKYIVLRLVLNTRPIFHIRLNNNIKLSYTVKLIIKECGTI